MFPETEIHKHIVKKNTDHLLIRLNRPFRNTFIPLLNIRKGTPKEISKYERRNPKGTFRCYRFISNPLKRGQVLEIEHNENYTVSVFEIDKRLFNLLKSIKHHEFIVGG